ncbi:MAG: hypothetical protein ACI8XG_001373 [Congregibacter sp.]|jgi:hypothetical protein
MVTKKNQQYDTALKKPEKVEGINSIIPAKVNFPIVGTGPSARGLAAFDSFFSVMLDDKNMNVAS